MKKKNKHSFLHLTRLSHCLIFARTALNAEVNETQCDDVNNGLAIYMKTFP